MCGFLECGTFSDQTFSHGVSLSHKREVLCWCFAVLSSSAVLSMPEGYSGKRNFVRFLEQQMGTGKQDDNDLTDEETRVDAILMEDKIARISDARDAGKDFPAGRSFLSSRLDMENTTAFRIIKKMPKGGLLHVHKTAIAGHDWVIDIVTYRPDLYMCVDSDFNAKFLFSRQLPKRRNLYNNLSMVRPDPATFYTNVDQVWDVFESIFDGIGGLLYHTPVWKDYLKQSLIELMQDNVQYVEIRGSLPKLYELDGTIHEREWSIENAYKPVIQYVQQNYPDFCGVKLILTKYRQTTEADMLKSVKQATRLFQQYPDLVVGFDVVGQEDTTKPLSDFIGAFLDPSQLNPPVYLPYYFHAGETVWQETQVDYNLLDAILLNTSRIGHGYALTKHPMLLQMVNDGKIAVEVCPISNQVLMMLGDLRNHPAAVLLASNVPVVISSDDPPFWDALPLSHDFYVTFMALTGEDSGLATLKQLALNSIKYSAMTQREKEVAEDKWKAAWNKFILEILEECDG